MSEINYGWSLAGQLLKTKDKLCDELYNVYRDANPVHFLEKKEWKKYLKAGDSKNDRVDNKFGWMPNTGTIVTYAREDDILIGYAIIWKGYRQIVSNSPERKVISLLLQIAVDSDHQTENVYQKLLFPAWGIANETIWGTLVNEDLVIMALKSITHRERVLSKSQYIESDRVESILKGLFKARFLKKIRKVHPMDFKFCHNKQEMEELNDEEQAAFWQNAEIENRNAYGDMNMGAGNQIWETRTKSEIDFLIKKLEIKENAEETSNYLVYDVGCGAGRHSMELAKRGLVKEIVAFDYEAGNVQTAKDQWKRMKNAPSDGKSYSSITFEQGDATDYVSTHPDKMEIADRVFCLFDVICTFTDLKMDKKIMKTVYDLCKPGGMAVFTAMNYDVIARKNFTKYDPEKSWSQLYDLPVSTIMATTGDVHDPEFCLIDTDNMLCYRRERFNDKNGYPVIKLVSDRRYTKDSLKKLCEEIGFEVEEVCTRNSGFLSANGKKEVIVICKKSDK